MRIYDGQSFSVNLMFCITVLEKYDKKIFTKYMYKKKKNIVTVYDKIMLKLNAILMVTASPFLFISVRNENEIKNSCLLTTDCYFYLLMLQL